MKDNVLNTVLDTATDLSHASLQNLQDIDVPVWLAAEPALTPAVNSAMELGIVLALLCAVLLLSVWGFGVLKTRTQWFASSHFNAEVEQLKTQVEVGRSLEINSGVGSDVDPQSVWRLLSVANQVHHAVHTVNSVNAKQSDLANLMRLNQSLQASLNSMAFSADVVSRETFLNTCVQLQTLIAHYQRVKRDAVLIRFRKRHDVV